MENKLYLSDLFITQRDLRHPEVLPKWENLVMTGKIFSEAPIKIKISCFPDGKMFVRDGHHRCVSIHRSGRTWLDPLEFDYEFWGSYESWMHPNLERDWITPFDPRIELRLGNLSDFKKAFANFWHPDDQMAFIGQNRQMYCRPREGIYTVTDLSNLEKLR